MVVAGLGIGPRCPAVPRVELEPDTVLVVFLPPILFSAAYFLSPRELWRNIRPITLLAVGLVIMTTTRRGRGRGDGPRARSSAGRWRIALGAIVSPPDAIAATSIARRLEPAAPARHHPRGREPRERRDGADDLPARRRRGRRPARALDLGAGRDELRRRRRRAARSSASSVGWVDDLAAGAARATRRSRCSSRLLAPFAAYLPAEAARRLRRARDRRRRPLRRLAGAAHHALGHARPRHRRPGRW